MKVQILNHWQIQESLLQSYRRLFLTSETIIFSVASIIAAESQPNKLVFLILLILGSVLLYFWFQIGKARGLDVSYFQMLLLRAEKGEEIKDLLTNFKKWQFLDKKEKNKILAKFKLEKSRTRTTMEIYVPSLFIILWLGLGLTIFCCH